MSDPMGFIHAHELSAQDRAFIAALTGATLAPSIVFRLPSGCRVTGMELQRWVAPRFTPDPETLRWAAGTFRELIAGETLTPAVTAVARVAEMLMTFADQFDPSIVDKLATYTGAPDAQ